MNVGFEGPSDPARADSTADLRAALHRRLAHFNRRRLRPSIPQEQWREILHQDFQLSLLEGQFVEHERAAIQSKLAFLPEDAEAFTTWFEALHLNGVGQGDPLFEWLATEATIDDMRWFLAQEVAGEAGFDDLVALTQVRLPPQAKLELARNYWDEMGRGRAARSHGALLENCIAELRLKPVIETTVWESLALGNLMVGMATNRRYTYHSLGALGVVELTAPSRVAKVDEGLKRLGIQREARRYFTLHATLDQHHSREWNREVIHPLMQSDPGLGRALAEGALMRLAAGARCFERYRRALMSSQYPSAARSRSLPARGAAPISFR